MTVKMEVRGVCDVHVVGGNHRKSHNCSQYERSCGCIHQRCSQRVENATHSFLDSPVHINIRAVNIRLVELTYRNATSYCIRGCIRRKVSIKSEPAPMCYDPRLPVNGTRILSAFLEGRRG